MPPANRSSKPEEAALASAPFLGSGATAQQRYQQHDQRPQQQPRGAGPPPDWPPQAPPQAALSLEAGGKRRQYGALLLGAVPTLVALFLVARYTASKAMPSLRRGSSAEQPLSDRSTTAGFAWDSAGGGSSGSSRRPSGAGAALAPPLAAQIAEDLMPWREGGISLGHVEQAYCGSNADGMRVQVVGGKLFIAGLTRAFETRLLAVARMLFRVHRVLGPLPDLDLVLEQQDIPTVTPTSTQCPERGPLLHHYKELDATGAPLPKAQHIVLMPDWSWFDWPETTMLLWEEEWAMLQLAAEAHPWEARSPDIFFRGGPASNEFRKALNSSMAAWRAKHEPMSAGDRDVAALQALDLVLTSVFQPGAVRVPFPEHCQHKVLLHIAGVSNSGRFKYLLGCGSPVVAFDLPGHRYKEWWFGLLQNGTNVYWLPWDKERDPAELLYETTQRLLAQASEAQRLGAGAAQLFERGLHPRVPLLYWHALLTEYASLLRFQPTRHPDAVPIEQVLAEMARKVKPLWQRTCSMCPGRPAPQGQG